MSTTQNILNKVQIYSVLATGERWPSRREGLNADQSEWGFFQRFEGLKDDPRYQSYGDCVDDENNPKPGAHGGGLFPVLAKTPKGTLVCAIRTGAAHKHTPRAQISITLSHDKGQTWSPYQVVVEGGESEDARNPALGILDDHTFVMSYGITNTKTNKHWMEFVRSTDAGKTWSASVAVPIDNDGPWLHPHGQMRQIGPQSLVFNSRGAYTDEQYRLNPDLPGREAWLHFSHDGGRSFEDRIRIGSVSETTFLPLTDKHWVCYSRDHKGAAVTGSSNDSGRTWNDWNRAYPNIDFRTNFSSYIAPGSMTKLPSGRLLLVHTYREHPFGLRVVVGNDGENFDWNGAQVLTDSYWTFDSGYPSAVCLDDGTVVVVAYAILDLANPDWGTSAIAYVFNEADLV